VEVLEDHFMADLYNTSSISSAWKLVIMKYKVASNRLQSVTAKEQRFTQLFLVHQRAVSHLMVI